MPISAIGFDRALPAPGHQVRRGHWSTDGLRSLLVANTRHPSVRVFDVARDLWTPAGIGIFGGTNRPTNDGLIKFSNVYDGISIAQPSADVVPASRVTILSVFRKTDTTARTSSNFAIQSATVAHYCQAEVPWTDNKVYWEFGGTAGYNYVASAAITITTDPIAWAFVAGQRGLALYRDGILLASNTTAAGRTETSLPFLLSNGTGGNVAYSDFIEQSFFAVLDAEWSIDQVREWTVNQSVMFAPRRVVSYFTSSLSVKRPVIIGQAVTRASSW